MVIDKKCTECGGSLILQADDYTEQAKAKYLEEFGEEMPIPAGYRCVVCGQCHDKDCRRLPWKVHMG